MHYNGYHHAEKGNKEDLKTLGGAPSTMTWPQWPGTREKKLQPTEMNRKELLPDVHATNGDDDDEEAK